MDALAKQLTGEGRFAALRFSCARGQPLNDDIAKAEEAIIQSIIYSARFHLPEDLQCPNPPQTAAGTRLGRLRKDFSERPRNFPHSVVLIGMRDVCNYVTLSGSELKFGGMVAAILCSRACSNSNYILKGLASIRVLS